MAYSEALAQRIRAVLGDSPVTEKKMFGGIAFMIGGNMAAGVSGDGLMVRVGLDAYAKTLEEPNVAPFGPADRPMRGWVLVDAAGIATDEALAGWVERGMAFASTLPPK